LDSIEISGAMVANAQFTYQAATVGGFLGGLQISGADLTTSDLVELISRKWIDYIQTINLINTIVTVQTINSILKINEIVLVDTVTTLGTVNLVSLITKISEIVVIDSVTIANVKTTAGTNILIDLLQQGSYIERQSTIKNDSGITTPTAPPFSGSFNLNGKFFPRGVRGFLDALQIYCINTSGGTITLSYAPNIGMGAVGTVTITPNATWNWQTGLLTRMWNYDSLFVWVSAISADAQFGFDQTAPTDMYNYNSTVPNNWSPPSNPGRMYLRAVYTGETVGDVPVSGTVNNVAIPNTTSARGNSGLSIPAGSSAFDTIQIGSGQLLYVLFETSSDNGAVNLVPRILCDGTDVSPFQLVSMKVLHDYYITQYSPEAAIGLWDTVNHVYSVIIAIQFSFKQSVQIGMQNLDAVNPYTCVLGYSFQRIS
jgi:hypothetical protein